MNKYKTFSENVKVKKFSQDKTIYKRLAKIAIKIYEYTSYISNFTYKNKVLDFSTCELLSAVYIMMINRRLPNRTDKYKNIQKSVADYMPSDYGSPDGTHNGFDLDKFEMACKEVFEIQDAEKLAKERVMKAQGYSDVEITEEVYFNTM